MAQPISTDLVGQAYDPVAVGWQDFDVQLYALGVGCKPEAELDFLYENRGPKVLPTFAVIPSMNVMTSAVSQLQINLAMLLHGEQSVTLHRPLPSRFKGQGQARISEVWDKGKAAVVGVESTLSDADGPLCTSHATLFIRGAGGFGGERGPSAADTTVPVPDRPADHVIEDQTRPEQAALYRLSGDRNPIHIDPQFARFGGFERPFLHGLCTYGYAGRAALQALCGGDPARLLALGGRFSAQVYPGDGVTTRIWHLDSGQALLQVESADGEVVFSNGLVHFSEESAPA
ncbi:MAG: MaoC/PaaZ C-terminal domain-containing protein [Alcanivoracaceae bacterium]|jgi:acyl dehydratase|nr:MaoC/PaaZ C-terminal domain-containing protein [Alcanivoracaceae bacterium]